MCHFFFDSKIVILVVSKTTRQFVVKNHGDRFLIPGYDLASLLSLRFVVLPAKVITFLESSKLFVEESKAWPNDSSIFA